MAYAAVNELEMYYEGPASCYCCGHAGHGVLPKETILTFLQEAATGDE